MRISTKMFTVLALAVAVGLATAVLPYASSSPDGLEKVAGDKAFPSVPNRTSRRRPCYADARAKLIPL